MSTRAGKMIGFQPFHSTPKNIAPKKLAGADGWLVVAPWVYESGEVSSIGTVQRVLQNLLGEGVTAPMLAGGAVVLLGTALTLGILRPPAPKP